jgi:phage terminase large subunit-like protein
MPLPPALLASVKLKFGDGAYFFMNENEYKQALIERIELNLAIEEKIREKLLHDLYGIMYPWQRRFNAATKDNLASLLMAANQVGKTQTGCVMDGIHMTGEYPDEWEGHKFDFPPLMWLLGYSGEKCRDLLQKKLFGRIVDNELEGGYIPKEKIVDYIAMPGTTGGCREVRIKHEKGISTCQFWSYSQGQHALMGDVVDWYHIDEEPKDQHIYPQVLTRTLNGDQGKGGRGILTLTPENGKTELVEGFMDNPEEGQYMQTATWDDAPHLNEAAKKQILAAYPPYQRDMRSRGIPLMGSGKIFPIDETKLSIKPFKIPEYWFVINGMDFGWAHPQAHLQLVWDRDNDTYYTTNGWKGSNKQPYEAWHIVKPWAANIPTAWPHDGLQTEKGSAKQQMTYYTEEGFNMLSDHATWPDGTNGVWAGIMELINLMETGRLFIFSNLFQVFEEIREYHTKTTASGNVEIVKKKDDLIDSLRYAYMMRRHAIRICDIDQKMVVESHNELNPGMYENF